MRSGESLWFLIWPLDGEKAMVLSQQLIQVLSPQKLSFTQNLGHKIWQLEALMLTYIWLTEVSF